MFHRFFICTLMLVVIAMAFAADVTVTMNGKTVTVPVIVQDGKAFVDLVALMKLLGTSATFNADTNKIVVGGNVNGSDAASGTPQLPGEDGKLGQIYKMRKVRPLFFALLSAEYTTDTIVTGSQCTYPRANEKLLVLHFTIQNPNQEEELVRFDSLRFTAIDAMNVNHEFNGNWGDEETHGVLNIKLKPAQKIAAYVAITVPAKGIVPKLMVLPGDDGLVLRYDLHEKVTALTAPIADPADGATARESVPAEFNASYPFSEFTAALEKYEFTTDPILGIAPKVGGRYIVFTLLTKNITPSPLLLRFDSFQATCTSTNGEDFIFRGSLLLAGEDRKFEQNVKPGAETRVRLYFSLPEGITPKTLTLKRGVGREFVFTLPEA